MRQSTLFTKTRREAPADEVSKNAQLLIRGGFIHKELAGVYSYLPLGLRVLRRIEQVIREEMNAIGGQELIMSALQDKELWEKTDRWDDAKVDNWFKTTLNSGGETGLGITHEEPLTQVMKDHINSYRDLPVLAYQFQTKFRNEMRAKSGVMRGKEFVMKDLYSFAATEEDHMKLYNSAREAYKKIFERVGIGDKTHVTFASGGIFSEFSEEFQTECEAGEDITYVDEGSGIAINKEVLTDETLAKLSLTRETLVEKKTVESGNIFHLGTKFSEPLNLKFKDETGAEKPVIMGSYGLGPTRLMGTVVEILSDEKGIIWPKEVAPFQIHLVELSGGDAAVKKSADELYEMLTKNGVEVLYDDRDARAGEKFSDAELIGIPKRVVVSAKTSGTGTVEVTDRKTGASEMMDPQRLIGNN